jgi:hypothetical protein
VIEPIRLDSTSFCHRQRPYLKPVFGTKLVQSLIGLARIQRKTKDMKRPEPAPAKGYSQTRRTRLDFTTSPRKKTAKDHQDDTEENPQRAIANLVDELELHCDLDLTSEFSGDRAGGDSLDFWAWSKDPKSLAKSLGF